MSRRKSLLSTQGHLLLFLAVSLFGLQSCSEIEHKVRAPQDVQIYRVGTQLGAANRDFPAVIQANNLSTLTFRLDGELVELPAIASMRVRKGDLLARIDPSDFKRRVTETEESFNLASLNYKRAQELIKTGAISDSEYDLLEAEYFIAKASFQMAKVNLGFTELRAPKDGVVGNVLVDNFQNVKLGQPIVTLYDPDTLEVHVNVSEQLLALAKSNRERSKRTFEVTFESLPGQVFTASNYEFETEKDPKTKSYRASLLMDKPKELTILPGMSAIVSVDMSTIEREVFEGIVLPSTAVLFTPDAPIDEQSTFVWILDETGTHVTRQNIQTRKLAKQGVEVRGGIKPGDAIVVYGQQQLFEGAPVNVVSEKEIN